MKISEVLREARKVFIEEGYEFVCIAVDETSAPHEEKYETKEYIRSLIHPHDSVTKWLNKEAGIEWEQCWHRETIIPYRICWIDHMVKELEKEGK